jgi:pimeloyl-ACP methyl ester carboxylesterase
MSELLTTTLSEQCDLDFIEAGEGELVVLVHSSTSGARQWSRLTQALESRALVRAVNLFGYGGTPAWSQSRPPTLDDYAELVARAVPEGARGISLVGHSLGGAVAMHAAAGQLRGRVARLVLFEPSLFYLLGRTGHHDEFLEIVAMASSTRQHLAEGRRHAAVQSFIDYWGGEGAWNATSAHRQSEFLRLVPLAVNEWNAVLSGQLELTDWAADLPADTLIMMGAGTRRPSAALAQLLSDARPDWQFIVVPDGGHLAPITHPHLVNPIIQAFLTRRR